MSRLNTVISSLPSQNRWLMLAHQLPPRPSNPRVRIWRRLQLVGAIVLRNAVYVLPAND